MTNFKLVAVAIAVVLSFSNCKKKASSSTPEPAPAPTLSVPTVNTGLVSDIGASKVKVSGDVTNDGGAAVTARGVCWSKTINPVITDSKSTNGSGIGSFTSSLTGLSFNTVYHVRAYATNSEGTAYGPDITFTTASFSLTAIIGGSTPFSATSFSALTAFGIFSIGAIDGNKQISLFLPSSPTVGTYNLQVLGNYDAQFSPNRTAQTVLTVKSGSIEITEVNTANGKIKGTFSFVAEEFNVPATPTVSITNGAFEVYK
jgi:Family of unknown function (DUF6252)